MSMTSSIPTRLMTDLMMMTKATTTTNMSGKIDVLEDKGVHAAKDRNPIREKDDGHNVLEKNTGKSLSESDVDEMRFAGIESFGKIDAEHAKVGEAKGIRAWTASA
ncbi:MAG: hypothetical protein M1826_007279 [Phylliscum demangeonii]|nr:MAG: hypothetical protein M1826_007279 [Phylliscum demangeonii]